MTKKEIYEINGSLENAILVAFENDKYRFTLNSELIDVNNRFRIFSNKEKTYLVKRSKLTKGKKEIEFAKKAFDKLDNLKLKNFKIKVVMPKIIEINNEAYLVTEYLGFTLQEVVYNGKLTNPITLDDIKEILEVFKAKNILYRGFLPRNTICTKDVIYLFDWEDSSFIEDNDSYVINRLWETNFLLNWGYLFDQSKLKEIIRKYQKEDIEPDLLGYEKCFCNWTGYKGNLIEIREFIEKIVLSAEAPIENKCDEFYIKPNDLAHLVSDIYNTNIDVLFDITSYILRNKNAELYQKLIIKISNEILNNFMQNKDFAQAGMQVLLEMFNAASDTNYMINKKENIKSLISFFDNIPSDELLEEVINYIDNILSNSVNVVIETDNYLIGNSNIYKNVPGFYKIYLKTKSNNHNPKELAKIEYLLRSFLLNQNAQLVGIYREEDKKGKLIITIIPYYIEVFEKLNIDPDLFQPYIAKYLDSFDESYISTVNQTNESLRKYWERMW